jgi:hypothetical protein
MRIKLRDRIVYLEQFHVFETYGGILAGKPTKEFNEKLILRNRLDAIIHRISSLVNIKPDEYLLKTRLPLHECYAIITSDRINKDIDAHGSLLEIKWYSDLEIDIRSEIVNVIQGVDWNINAVDFYL